jgi:hypothetical protein
MMSSLSVRYEVLLPVRYNDGREVERAQHNACLDDVIEEFGGATLEPERLLGRWLFEGQEFTDTMLRLIVEVEDRAENHAWFAEWKETLKERFDQIDIRMTWHSVHIV